MDFHILTKKQAECLRQIHGRTKVSSFFEPLRTVRELESLVLIRRFPTTEFDSGFGYELTGAGMALMPFEAGTNYSFRDGGFVIINERPIHSETDRHLKQEVARLERSNNNLCDAMQIKDDLLLKRWEQINCLNDTVRDLNGKLESRERELVKAQDMLKLTKLSYEDVDRARRLAVDNNGRLATELRSHCAAVAKLQKIVDDYAQQQKVDREVIKNLERLSAERWDNGVAVKKQLQEANKEYNELLERKEPRWHHIWKMQAVPDEGVYVFANVRGPKIQYKVGEIKDSFAKDFDGKAINLNEYTFILKLPAVS